jgi:TPR repeat protein
VRRAAAIGVAALLAAVTPAFAQAPPPQSRAELEALVKTNAADAAATRRLGEMYLNGEDGNKDPGRGAKLLEAAAKSGDRYAPILLGDLYFIKVTRGHLPTETKFSFSGGLDVPAMKLAAHWYQAAMTTDDRPDARLRAQAGLNMLETYAKVVAEMSRPR